MLSYINIYITWVISADFIPWSFLQLFLKLHLYIYFLFETF